MAIDFGKSSSAAFAVVISDQAEFVLPHKYHLVDAVCVEAH